MAMAEREIALTEELRSVAERNQKLERALASSRAREESLWKKIDLMRIEERKLEEAEERLCAQLGQLEVEYMEQSRAHKEQLEMERSAHSRDLQRLAEEFAAVERRLEEAQAKLELYASNGDRPRETIHRQDQGSLLKSSGDQKPGKNGGGLERLLVMWSKLAVESFA
ncbi:hypothetical protein SELMODRAFT_408074 [Selaginella moellendorffii]|uniref:Uncharacterized protein n=1 Tax=Selaginella moellendorffii TaxID=88036 RepID=D8R741_SELML|nr:hypothetical protein SELMODRAFT_408074 [Selaginella moellendorffii]